MWNSADFEVLAEQIRRRRTLERDSEDELVEQIPVLARADRRRTPVFHAHEPALLETSNALPADTAADSEVGREIHLPGQDVPGREPAGDDLAGELRPSPRGEVVSPQSQSHDHRPRDRVVGGR